MDEDVGKMAQATPVLVAKSLEIFVQSLIDRSCDETRARNSKRMSSAHLKRCIFTYEQFDFLKDVVESVPDLADDPNLPGGGNPAKSSSPGNDTGESTAPSSRGGENHESTATVAAGATIPGANGMMHPSSMTHPHSIGTAVPYMAPQGNNMMIPGYGMYSYHPGQQTSGCVNPSMLTSPPLASGRFESVVPQPSIPTNVEMTPATLPPGMHSRFYGHPHHPPANYHPPGQYPPFVDGAATVQPSLPSPMPSDVLDNHSSTVATSTRSRGRGRGRGRDQGVPSKSDNRVTALSHLGVLDMVFYLLGRVICHGIGHLYPAYASYKALKGARNATELTHWLTYWLVIGAFTCVEFVTDLFIFWLPFYNLCKITLVLWLVLPQTQGATYVYKQVLRPWLVEHEEEIDCYLYLASNRVKAQSSQWGQRGIETLHQIALDGLTRGQAYIVDQVGTTGAGPRQRTGMLGNNTEYTDRIEELTGEDNQSNSASVGRPTDKQFTIRTTADNFKGFTLGALTNWASQSLGQGLARLSPSITTFLASLNSLAIGSAAADPEQIAAQQRLISSQRQKLEQLLHQLTETETQLQSRKAELLTRTTTTNSAKPLVEQQPSMTSKAPMDGYDSAEDMVFLTKSTANLATMEVDSPDKLNPDATAGALAKPGWLW
ncbi:hypothetical protein IWQ61_008257 [Dispira simplex]|nr:hypothetical protein IWQ61_008257 [Dispira simplex]